MSDHRQSVLTYWASAEARDWDTFATVLAEPVRYELPQTGERITGRERYVRFNREYPGDWHLAVRDVLVDGDRAVSRLDFTVDGGTQQAVTFFAFDDAGLITGVVDFWPAAYEPPPGREHLVDRA
ncbi:MAG TPA: nuclear transport factor 2 family protein [Actinocatenispora sp.]